MSDKPKRAVSLICSIGADTPDDMAHALRNMAAAIDRKELTRGCWGSPSDGAIYEYTEKDHPTHDEYFAELRRYLDESAKPPHVPDA
jgi:hypothetical protein